MARQVAWVAYHDGIDRVEVLKRRVDPSKLLRPCANPVMVEDEEGERFVVSLDRCYDNPMDAHLAAVKLRQDNDIEEPEDALEDEGEDEDLDPDEDEDEDEDGEG